jgi:hypothetical protein
MHQILSNHPRINHLPKKKRKKVRSKGGGGSFDTNKNFLDPIPKRKIAPSFGTTKKIYPQNRVKSFRMFNFLVIVLDNPIRIIKFQKQWGGGRATAVRH